MKHVKKGVTLIVILMAATVGTGFAAFHMYELWYDQSNSSSDSAGATSSAVTSRGLEIQAGIDAVGGGFVSKEGLPPQNRLTTFSEPTAMLLFGISLVGLAQLVRKKTVTSRDREGQDQAGSGSRR